MLLFLCAVILTSGCAAQCPDSIEMIEPCTCDQETFSMSCGRDITLPRLTTVLSRAMCGRQVDRFEMREANLTYLPSDLFLKMSVREISISYMSITRFTDAGTSAFQGLEDILESLSMRHCTQLDRLHWQMLGPLRAISQLDLSYNDLTMLPAVWFQTPPPNLRILLLKGNKISSLEPGSLSFLHKLVQLDLSENEIIELSRSALPNPGNTLIFLGLSYNQLESVPEDLFDEMLNVRRIYLNNNRIRVLGSKETWSPIWGDLDVLDLNGNSLECFCEAQWISELRSPRLLYGECTNPSDLRGLSLKSLQPDHFQSCPQTTEK